MSDLHNPYPPRPAADDLEPSLADQDPDPAVQLRREQLRAEQSAAALKEEERRLRIEKALRDRDTENASRGILIGVIVTSLLGLGILFWYLLTRPEPTPQPVVVPEPSTTGEQQPPNINITVPPSPSQPSAPDVNTEITVPSTSPPAATGEASPPTEGVTPATPTPPATDSAPASEAPPPESPEEPPAESSEMN